MLPTPLGGNGGGRVRSRLHELALAGSLILTPTHSAYWCCEGSVLELRNPIENFRSLDKCLWCQRPYSRQ